VTLRLLKSGHQRCKPCRLMQIIHRWLQTCRAPSGFLVKIIYSKKMADKVKYHQSDPGLFFRA